MASKKPANRKKQTYHKPRTAADKAMNVVFTLLALIMLGVAVWAVWPKISSRIADSKADTAAQTQDQQTQQTQTIADVAGQLGIGADEFIQKYGLNADEVSAESDFSAVMSTMSMGNFYNFQKDMHDVQQAQAEAAEETQEEPAAEGEQAADGEAAEGEETENAEAADDGKAAEEYVFPDTFEKFIEESGLDPASVTEDMTVEEAQQLLAAANAQEDKGEGEAQEDTSEPAPELED